jgi:hypothetical protein
MTGWEYVPPTERTVPGVRVGGMFHRAPSEEAGRLWAAAPALLEALEAVDRQVFCDCPERNGVVGHEPGCFVPLARSALNLARGGE